MYKCTIFTQFTNLCVCVHVYCPQSQICKWMKLLMCMCVRSVSPAITRVRELEGTALSCVKSSRNDPEIAEVIPPWVQVQAQAK